MQAQAYLIGQRLYAPTLGELAEITSVPTRPTPGD
jgi:hypothetical protein